MSEEQRHSRFIGAHVDANEVWVRLDLPQVGHRIIPLTPTQARHLACRLLESAKQADDYYEKIKNLHESHIVDNE